MDLHVERIRGYAPVESASAVPEAAVCVPLVDGARGHELLFTERAAELHRHPGEMSFPGGGREAGDEDLVATARREAEEEVGLDPDEAELVGQLDDATSVTDIVVRPFVFDVPDRAYRPASPEVASVVRLPVRAFARPGSYESELRGPPADGGRRLHVFRVGGHVIWGFTAGLVVSLLEVASSWRAPDEVDRVVDVDADLPE